MGVGGYTATETPLGFPAPPLHPAAGLRDLRDKPSTEVKEQSMGRRQQGLFTPRVAAVGTPEDCPSLTRLPMETSGSTNLGSLWSSSGMIRDGA